MDKTIRWELGNRLLSRRRLTLTRKLKCYDDRRGYVAHKQLRFDTDARRAMETGVDKLANAVRTRWVPRASTSSCTSL